MNSRSLTSTRTKTSLHLFSPAPPEPPCCPRLAQTMLTHRKMTLMVAYTHRATHSPFLGSTLNTLRTLSNSCQNETREWTDFSTTQTYSYTSLFVLHEWSKCWRDSGWRTVSTLGSSKGASRLEWAGGWPLGHYENKTRRELCEALPRTGKEKEKYSGNSIAYAGRVTAAKAEHIPLKTDPHKDKCKEPWHPALLMGPQLVSWGKVELECALWWWM